MTDELYRTFLALLQQNADVSQEQLQAAVDGVSAGSFTLPANTLAGNDTVSPGLATGITVGSGLTLSGGQLTASGGGSGDMTKAVYDPDNDGKVTSAATADDALTLQSWSPLQLRSRSSHTGTQTLSTISDAGSAAALNAPVTGNALTTQVVKGDDTRLTNSRSPVDNSVSTVKLQANSVTYPKLQATTQQCLLGSQGAGDVSEVTLGTGLSMAGGVLNAATGGDMTKAVYDTNDNGIVDNAAALGGQTSAYHLSRANHTGTQALATITDAGTAAALDVAASGNASAGEVVKGDDTRLTDQRVPTDNSVGTAKLLDSSVTDQKLAANSVVTDKIVDSNVTTAKLANNAVTYSKLQEATGPSVVGAGAAGNFEEISLGTNLSITGGVLNASVSGGGGGDMLKSVYDIDDNGIVDNSELLGGEDSAHHLNRANHTGTQDFSSLVSYTSGDIALVASAIVSQAHGLGATPSLAKVYFKCTVANNGYAVGDLVDAGQSFYPGSPGYNIMGPVLTPTHVKFSVTSGGNVAPSMTVGNSSVLLNGAQWVYIIRAWV